tara:strand:+ start:8573 stop:8980 length:408 start_codon:yes stop_codon:yes gene_type:complete
MITGYTTGVFDLFHIGHLNILKNASSICDRLIVGVTTDEYCKIYKGNKPVIPYEHRFEIIKNIRFVDLAVPQENHNKMKAWEKYKFNIMIVGDDWKNTKEWNEHEKQFSEINVEIAYLPRTKNISSSSLRNIVKK